MVLLSFIIGCKGLNGGDDRRHEAHLVCLHLLLSDLLLLFVLEEDGRSVAEALVIALLI